MSRLKKLSNLLQDHGIESFLISSPSNIYFLTGFRGLAPWERECFLLYFKKIFFLITDKRYEEQVKSVKDIQIAITEPGQNYYQKIVSLITQDQLSATHSKLSFEYRDLKYLEFEYIGRLVQSIDLEPQDGVVEELRISKDSDEVHILSEACRITDQVFDAIKNNDLIGKTEAEVSFLIETLSRKFGGEGNSFIPIVASGLNSSLSHHRPDNTKITEGPLFIDFGVKYEGYTSDITRTLWIDAERRSDDERQREGATTISMDKSEFEDTYKKILEAQQTAINKIKPGMLGKEAYQIACDVLSSYGLAQYFHHSLGHGVGIDIHENPRLSKTSNMVLQENMVFTIEPGVYIPGKFGIQIEDTFLLARSGCSPLTKALK